MKIIEKDILTVEKGIIFQQVNCKLTQGSGLALAIRNKWPKVYDEYITLSKRYKNDFERLGLWQNIEVGPELYVCNVFGQLSYGYDNKQYTCYGALKTAFEAIDDTSPRDNNLGFIRQFYFPYLMSCFRGGGDWNIVSKMIEFYFPNAIICKLPEK